MKDVDLLEKVQRRARKSYYQIYLIYCMILVQRGFCSLYCRRQRGDLIEAYKILNGFYDINPTSFFTLNNTDTTSGHHHKLFKF